MQIPMCLLMRRLLLSRLSNLVEFLSAHLGAFFWTESILMAFGLECVAILVVRSFG